ncbi:hypothetical protein NC652_024285 [Populus alba x Populus x berolinensis]|nr:hypothetical protein NC652_024285 [Populus alba x Populus x berolinensis]
MQYYHQLYLFADVLFYFWEEADSLERHLAYADRMASNPEVSLSGDKEDLCPPSSSSCHSARSPPPKTGMAFRTGSAVAHRALSAVMWTSHYYNNETIVSLRLLLPQHPAASSYGMSC